MNNAPPRRPPRRWKSTSTDASDLMLDDISEVAVFQPRAPTRNKSSEDLDAELFLGRAAMAAVGATGGSRRRRSGDIPESIDLGQLSSNLQDMQLEHPLNDDHDDFDPLMDNEIMSVSSMSQRGHLGPTHSFSSIGSSMTMAQQREPGRFVTPASSFNLSNDVIPTCQGVEPHQRVTVDPFQFVNADLSFRLPLVGPITDSSSFVVHKKCSSGADEKDVDLFKAKGGGRKTIRLDKAAMPTINLGSDAEDANEEITPEVLPKPAQFGLRRESRTLMRPTMG